MSWGEGSSILLEGTVRVSFSDGAQLLLRPNMDQVTLCYFCSMSWLTTNNISRWSTVRWRRAGRGASTRTRTCRRTCGPSWTSYEPRFTILAEAWILHRSNIKVEGMLREKVSLIL